MINIIIIVLIWIIVHFLFSVVFSGIEDVVKELRRK